MSIRHAKQQKYSLLIKMNIQKLHTLCSKRCSIYEEAMDIIVTGNVMLPLPLMVANQT